MLAANSGAADSVSLLLGKGADPTIRDIDGRTVVYNAVGHGTIMEMLLAVSIYYNTICIVKPLHTGQSWDQGKWNIGV